MKATDLLKEDHSRVERLFKKVEDSPKGEHPALFAQIKAELDVHAHIEEVALYPTLIKKGNKELEDITREGIEEHGQAKMFLADLASTTARNKQYEAKLKVLMEDIRHHVKEEENEMFKMLEDQFSEAQQEKIGQALEAARAAFIPKMTEAERAALRKSLEASDEKGMIGKMYEKAVEVVGSLLSGENSENGDADATSAKRSTGNSNSRLSKAGAAKNADSKTKTAKAPAAKKTAATRSADTKSKSLAKVTTRAKNADVPAKTPKTAAEKRSSAAKKTVRKVQQSRAMK